jgi:hypothetical protein
MTILRWMLVVAAVGVLTWGVRRDGFIALAWEAPVVGACMGIFATRDTRWRIAASVLGGALASGFVWFMNFFLYRQYTFVTVFVMPKEPFTEALAGALGGALVGLLVAGLAALPALPTALARFMVRDWMVAIAILALSMAGFVCFIRSPVAERLVMAGIAALVGLVWLVATVTYRRRHRSVHR